MGQLLDSNRNNKTEYILGLIKYIQDVVNMKIGLKLEDELPMLSSVLILQR